MRCEWVFVVWQAGARCPPAGHRPDEKRADRKGGPSATHRAPAKSPARAIQCVRTGPFMAICGYVRGLFGRENPIVCRSFVEMTANGARLLPVPPRAARLVRCHRDDPALQLGDPENKRAAPFRKRLLNGLWTFESPVHAVEATSRSSLAFAADPLDQAAVPSIGTTAHERDTKGRLAPPMSRIIRPLVTFMCCIDEHYTRRVAQ